MTTLYYESKRRDRKPDGFIYVASIHQLYYELALYSATTLKDYYPEADITLFTHESFVDERALTGLFDSVICRIPQSKRAKMWCMARTPYESSTAYIDCDSFIRHRDISRIHEFAHQNDLNFGSNALYTVASPRLVTVDKEGQYPAIHHGSICIYKSTPKNLSFHDAWYTEYHKQISEDPWPYEDWAHPIWRNFDMFTLWRMAFNHNNEFPQFEDLSVESIPHRWNATTLHHKSDIGKNPPVVVQIDRNTIAEIPYLWNDIRKNLNKPSLECNPHKFD
jgi:hypothetical protein